MFATIEVRKDDTHETLCFRSGEDAKQFQEFVRTYMRESGAGNGYGAYWIFDLDIGFYERVPVRATTRLEGQRLENMLQSILRARTAKEKPDTRIPFLIGSENGAVVFEIGELPSRQRPTVGDMFRVIGTEATAKERDVVEGRVLQDFGDSLEVISSWDEDDAGKPKLDAKRVLVRTSQVMKINDWKKRIRSPSV